MQETTNLKPGELVLHFASGIIGTVKKLWTPNSYGEPPIPCECIEFEDGNVLLGFARGPSGEIEPTVGRLEEKEALMYRQMVALLAHTTRETAVLARAMGLGPARAALILRASLSRQLAELR